MRRVLTQGINVILTFFVVQPYTELVFSCMFSLGFYDICIVYVFSSCSPTMFIVGLLIYILTEFVFEINIRGQISNITHLSPSSKLMLPCIHFWILKQILKLNRRFSIIIKFPLSTRNLWKYQRWIEIRR